MPQRQIEEMLDQIPSGVCVFDVTGSDLRRVYMNNGFYRMLGTTREERTASVGDGVFGAIYPEDRETVRRMIANADLQPGIRECEYRAADGKGGWLWVRVAAFTVEREADHRVSYVSFTNVDAEVRARKELQQSKAVLDAALRMVHITPCTLDLETRAMSIAPETARRLGLPVLVEDVPESLIAGGHIAPESAEPLRALYAKVYAGKAGSAEIRQRYLHDEDFWWARITYTPIVEEDGVVARAIGTSTSLQDVKNREKYYQDQLNMFRAVSEKTLGGWSFSVTRDVTLEVSEPRAGLFDVSVELAPSAMRDAVAARIENPDDKARFCSMFDTAQLKRSYEHDRHSDSMRVRLRGFNGWVECSYNLLVNPETGDMEAFVLINDATDEVMNELVANTLVGSDYAAVFTVDTSTGEARSYAYLDSKYVDGIVAVMEKGIHGNGFLEVMRAFCYKICPSPEEAERVFHANSPAVIEAALAKEKSYKTTYFLGTPDHLVRVRASYAPLVDCPHVVLCAFQNITAEYQQEQTNRIKLEEALSEANRANAAKTEFLSNMSHDMRTPMNGILGLTALARDKDDLASIKEDLAQIDISGHYLLRLINDTLDMSKIESGKLELHVAPIDSEELFRNVLGSAHLQAAEKGVDLRITAPNIAHGQWVRVLGDASRIEQVMVNIISNAIKYTPVGGSVELIMETLSVTEDTVSDRYIVRDTGIGMSADFLPHLFEPFSQEGRARTTREGGTGLGMSIVRELMDMMGGSIEVKSELDHGTEVAVTFHYPVARGEGVHDEGDPVDLSVLDGAQVLVCEDHPVNRDIAVRLLQKKGVTSFCAADGKEGLDLFRVHADAIDAILMDVRMPVMNGLEATRAIRALDFPQARNVPIIAMTANAFDDDVRECLDAGMSDHIAKPFEPDYLFETLARHLS